MKKQYQVNNEIFRCEPKARARFQELKFAAKQSKDQKSLELWELSEQTDIFGNVHQVKQLVTRYTKDLPNNGLFRINDVYDVRRAKKLYCLQKYDADNNCWNNFKMGDSVEGLLKFMQSYVSEVRQ